MKINQRYKDVCRSVVDFFEKTISVLGERKMIFIGTVLSKVFLDLAYCIVSPYWHYYGFIFQPTFLRILISWAVFGLCFMAIDDVYRQKQSNARPVFLILTYINFYPLLTSFGYGAISGRTLIYSVIYYGLLYYFSFRFRWPFRKKREWKILDIQSRSKLLTWMIAIACCLTIIIISGYYTGFRFSLDLDKVYEWRSENKASMSILARYAFGAAIACNITMLSYCLSKRKYVHAVVLMAIQIMAFSVDGLKSTLFVMVFAMVALFYRANNLERLIPAAVMGVAGLGIAEFLLGKSMFIINHLVRRVMLLPGVITDHYVDFFSKNAPDYFMQGPLRFLGFESAYEREISYLIGAEYYVDGINFNSGLLSEAVANLGFVGVIVMPILVAVFLRIYGKISKGLPNGVVFAVSLYVSWFLLSSTLTTTLASHGVLAMLIAIACLPKENNDGCFVEASK